jgi:hypothetical protein
MMGAIDFYWMKAGEALTRADAQPGLANFFLSTALAYRILADGEAGFRARYKTVSAPPLQAP